MAAKKSKTLTERQCRKIAMAAVRLLGDCADARDMWIEEGAEPSDADVYVIRRDVNVCHVEIVLEALGLKHPKSGLSGGVSK